MDKPDYEKGYELAQKDIVNLKDEIYRLTAERDALKAESETTYKGLNNYKVSVSVCEELLAEYRADIAKLKLQNTALNGRIDDTRKAFLNKIALLRDVADSARAVRKGAVFVSAVGIEQWYDVPALYMRDLYAALDALEAEDVEA